MGKNILLLFIVLVLGILLNSCNQPELSMSEEESKFSNLSGSYLGQKFPGQSPELFAPGLISTEHNELKISFSLNGKLCIYITSNSYSSECFLLFSELKDGNWLEPKEIPFSYGRENYERATISPDGKKIFFTSKRSEGESQKEKNRNNIWVIEQTTTGWGEPKKIDFGEEFHYSCSYPSLAKNENLYFQGCTLDFKDCDIFLSKYENEKYLKPEKLSDSINSTAYELHPAIAPDESYLIFDSGNREGNNFGSNDLYISFYDENNSWTQAVNMGTIINTSSTERRTFITYDGKYIFFVSNRVENPTLNNQSMTKSQVWNHLNRPSNGSEDFYWVDAKVIEDLKPEHLKLRGNYEKEF